MKSYLSAVVLFLSTSCFPARAFAQDGVIEIVEAVPVIQDSIFFAPVDPAVFIKFTNSTGVPIHTISTGFKITSFSSYGGHRGAVTIIPFYYSGTSSFADLFDLEAASFSGANSADVDTIGFFGHADSTNPSLGMPAAWSDNALIVELGQINSGPTVDRVCIDTCSLPPNRPWRWVNTSVTPSEQFTPSFVGLPYQVYQNGEGPDRIGSGYCWSVRGIYPLPTISNCIPTCIISGTPCTPFLFDFDAQVMEGQSYSFGKVSGPGTIDPNTGVWSWPNVSNADAGEHMLKIYVADEVTVGPISNIFVVVNPSPLLDITSGCSTDVLLTGVARDVQMGTSNGACDDNVWSMTQFTGSPTGATCSMDNTGKISFVASQPGVYEYRAKVTDGTTVDSCLHSFVVHGGPGCCVGMRGNIDGVGGVDLSDLSRLIAYMTNSFISLPCIDEANLSGTGNVDLTDLSIMILYLTSPGSVTIANCP